MFRTVLCFMVMTAACSGSLSAADRVRQDEDGRITVSLADVPTGGDEANQIACDYKPTRWGMYEVSLTYANGGPDSVAVEVVVGPTKVAGKLAATGGRGTEVTRSLGRLYLADAKPVTLSVRWPGPVEGVVVKAVTLSPACEGTPPTQADDGVVTLHGRDATVRGVTLRYEPAEKKQTLGFWTRPTDAAVWSFTLARPGVYDVEVLQGCGPGQGGSVMRVAVDGGEAGGPLTFTVEDTGGFQEFRPRIIGRVGPLPAGAHTLEVVPVRIARQAACDIRQVRLLPAAPAP
ncbi:MAG: hypothetical protein EBX36_04365 [Planctomycetia bacterium]|nr:hypothetical protein [Planctomycetia bacterium]